MGLNIGVIGALLLAAKVFDGFTDIAMGAVIDKTHTRWGKARPWALAIIPYWIMVPPRSVLQERIFLCLKSKVLTP